MAATLAGETREWHKITLDFAGPTTSETDPRNPFTDYRVDVTFRHQATGQTLTVPGFFAADGDAAQSHAAAGDVWRVHFAPPAEGAWTYTASFRTGANVAASTNPLAGASAGHFDGVSGSLDVAPTDKAGADFRGKGMLEYVGDHQYRFAETGEWFLKGGADSPENFLAYGGFDNTPATHAYAPHLGDWTTGDPTWAAGQGKGIIGAINYLAAAGVNSLYFLTMNIGGDGNDVSPWITSDAANPTRYDVSKLAQWDVLFDHMTREGVMMHVVTQETENDQLLDGGGLGVARAVYYRELIARFAHNPALQWNLGEENSNTDAQRKAFADYIRAVDPYDHPIVVHTFPGAQSSVFGPLLGGPALDGAALQTNDTHATTLQWVNQSAAAGHPWVVTLDEIGPASVGAATDANDPTHDVVRKQHLWGNLMAGGGGVEWYFGYSQPHNDLNLEDFRSRDGLWRQTDIALDFFREHLPFQDMTSADGLTPATSDYVLAKPGSIYAVYLPNGGASTLDLTGRSGVYEVDWFDPRNGGALQSGAVSTVAGGTLANLGAPPHDADKDWVVLVRSQDLAPPSPAKPGLAIVQSGGSSTVAEGAATDSLTVALASAPTSEVTVTVAGGADVQVSPAGGAAGSTATLVFTPLNWNTAQTIMIAAVNDDDAEGPETVGVNFALASEDGAYDGLSVAPVTVAVIDDDAGGDPEPPPAPPTTVVLDQDDALTGVLGAQNWGLVKVSALSWSNTPVLVSRTVDGLGVDQGRFAGQIDRNPWTGEAEVLRLEFPGEVQAATVRVGRMYQTENGGDGPEIGAWRAYDADGALVGQGLFDPRQGAPAGANVYDFVVDPAEGFARLDLTAEPYADATGVSAGDSSDYSLLRIAYELAATSAAFRSEELLA